MHACIASKHLLVQLGKHLRLDRILGKEFNIGYVENYKTNQHSLSAIATIILNGS